MDQYLQQQSVHKDFHGILNLLFDYIDESYGEEALFKMYSDIIKETYEPLINEIRATGLSAIEEHYKSIMKLEDGEHTAEYGNGTLTITVHRCPAVEHIKKNRAPISKHFCRISTVLVNEVIGDKTGYNCSVDYDQENGACTQVWEERK